MAQMTIDVDASRFKAKACVVRPHMPWVEDPATGKRKPSPHQGVGAGGQFLWEVDVLVRNRDPERGESVDKAMVLVEAQSLPLLPEDSEVPVTFEGLQVRVYNASAGGLGKAYSAHGMQLVEPMPVPGSRSRSAAE